MAGHGGRRAGAGRKAHYPPLKKRRIGLTDAQMALLRKWGRGDAAAGLRWLITAAAPLIKRRADLEGGTDGGHARPEICPNDPES